MTKPLALEDFGAAFSTSGAASPAQAAPAVAETLSEDEKLAAFEQGYQSGWDDCAAADAEQARRINADLAANLQDLSLTYAEARRDVLTSLTPFFEELVSQILPSLAAHALAPVVLAELRTAAETTSTSDATLLAAPAAIPALENLLDGQGLLEITLKAEPAYAEGQVSLRYGAERRDIDLSDAAQRIGQAIQDFVQQETQSPIPFDKGVAPSSLPTELAG